MPRKYRLYLEDMRDAILKIQVYSQAVSFDQLKNSPMLVDAVLHNCVHYSALNTIPESFNAEH